MRGRPSTGERPGDVAPNALPCSPAAAAKVGGARVVVGVSCVGTREANSSAAAVAVRGETLGWSRQGGPSRPLQRGSGAPHGRAERATRTAGQARPASPQPWQSAEGVNGRPNPAGASSGQRSHSQWRSWTGQRNAVVKSAFSRDQLESCLCALPAQSNTSDVGRAPLELPPLSGCPVLRLILGSRTRQHGRSCRLRSMTTLHQ